MFFKIENWNFQNLFVKEFCETSQNFNSIRQPIEKMKITIVWISCMSWNFVRFQWGRHQDRHQGLHRGRHRQRKINPSQLHNLYRNGEVELLNRKSSRKARQCSAMQFYDDLDFQIADTYLLSKGWLTRLVNLTWCLFTLWLIIIDLFLEKGQLFQKRRVGSRKTMLWNTTLLWYEPCDLESEINIGVHLSIFEKNNKKKIKMTAMPWLMYI